MNLKLLSVAKGETPADLVIRNGKIVNVYSGEIYEGGVAVCGDTIAAVGDVDYCVGEDTIAAVGDVEYCIGEGTRVVDAEGKYLTPGFLDGHIHPESSSLAIRSFAEAVLSHGTTGIMTDLHEVGVVSGLEGIEVLANLLELVGLSGGEPLDEALEDRGSKASVIGGKPCQLVIQPEQDAPRQLTGAGGQHLSGDHQACSASDLDIVVASFFSKRGNICANASRIPAKVEPASKLLAGSFRTLSSKSMQ